MPGPGQAPATGLSRRRLVTGMLAAPVAMAGPAPAAASDAPVVAASSDLRFALEEIAAAFARRSGRTVRLSFGSSGNIARQILAGAPHELFLAADEDYALQLVRAGLTQGEGRIYAVGRLALVAARNAAIAAGEFPSVLAEPIADGRIRRFAIANPEHAPYGERAREALQRTGLWEPLRARIVLGENVAQAAQFVASGAAQAGIIALPLANAHDLAAGLAWSRPVSDTLHAPLLQRLVLLRRAGAVARAFYAFLEDREAGAILERHGFFLP